MSDPESKFGRRQADGTFRPDDKYVPDGGIEHSADMARLIRHFDVAREAEYLARIAVGQNPLKSVQDKRRVKRQRVVEDLLKQLCWLNTPDSMMRKKNKPWLFGVDGERRITRRELEHLGCNRAWGGKYSEDQMDRALEALASVQIIERNKVYNPEKKTSKISIRLCPQTIMRLLAERKRARQSSKTKTPRKRAKLAIAADVIFLKLNFAPEQAIEIGERIRAASAELAYEPALKKYLVPLAACIEGQPCYVSHNADRRTVVEDPALVGFLKTLLKKWWVNPADLEFRHRPMSFTLDAWRAFSHDELKATGFSEAQIVRCKRLLVASEFLEWANRPSPGKNEPRIYARLRVDLVLNWILEFEETGRYSRLRTEANDGWFPSVIDPRSNVLLYFNESGSADSDQPGFRKIKKNKVNPAGAGADFSFLLRHSRNRRDALIRSPLASGDDTLQAITRLFHEIFAEYFANPETPLTHQIAIRLRAWANRGDINKKMTVADLIKWQHTRNNENPDSGDDSWKVHQTPTTPEEIMKMLNHWPGIKRLLYENPVRYADLEAQASLESWNVDALVLCKDELESCKSEIQSALSSGRRIRPMPGEKWLLPHLVALHELGLQDQLTEFINLNQAELQQATNRYPRLAVAIQNRHPELMCKLSLPPEHWPKLREKVQRAFHNAQVRKAKNSLEKTPIDDLDSAWRAEEAPAPRQTRKSSEATPPTPEWNTDFNSVPARPADVPLRCLPQLGAAMGGGFYWGDATMIAGINASGKSILAMQLADDFATQGYRTVVFTTQLPIDQLSLRCVSNRLSIDMAKLIEVEPDNNPPEKVSQELIPNWVWQNPARRDELLKLKDIYNANLRFIDWSRAQGHNVAEHFNQFMDNLEATGWLPQIVIFDWLGGDIDILRNINHIQRSYQAAADQLINYAKQTNRLVIMFAQLDKARVTGKTQYIDMSMVAECSALRYALANFIGITTLSDADRVEDGSESVYLDCQYLCLAKSKYGKQGRVPVKPVFKYQRFEEVMT